jgi:ribosomal protein S6--L-glutamate ligase
MQCTWHDPTDQSFRLNQTEDVSNGTELPMNCRDFSAAIDACLNDKLSGKEMLAFQNHLARCEECQALFTTEEKFPALLRTAHPLGLRYDNLEQMPAPENFWGRNKPPRVAIIAERDYSTEQMPGAVIPALKARGIDGDILCPDSGHFDPRTGIFCADQGNRFDLKKYDVVVSRYCNGLGLAMLSFADAIGILTINSAASISSIRNKSEMVIRLGRAAVLCAPTILAENISALSHLPSEWFPLILKPTSGVSSHGLQVIRQPEDVLGIQWEDDPVFAQRFLFNDGFEVNLYVCGGTVFALRKPSPITGDPKIPLKQIQPDVSMIELALKTGRVFGLEIYGVNAIETVEGLTVIDVHDLPNFTGVAGAPDRMVDHILSRSKVKMRLRVS